jgi:hypothetical protein
MYKMLAMHKIAVVVLLGFGIASAQATPIVFTSSSYTTAAFADVGGVSDGPFDAGAPPSLLSIISSASVTAVGGSAAANAIADNLLLAASSEAVSSPEVSSATAVSTFLGAFTTLGSGLSLHVNFEDFIDSLGGGSAGSELFVLLQVGGLTLLDASYTAAELIGADFMTMAGLPGVLDISLVSVANAEADGFGFNLASADFSLNSVPEPATLALVLGGMGLLGMSRGFGGRRAMG